MYRLLLCIIQKNSGRETRIEKKNQPKIEKIADPRKIKTFMYPEVNLTLIRYRPNKKSIVSSIRPPANLKHSNPNRVLIHIKWEPEMLVPYKLKQNKKYMRSCN